MDKTSFPRIQRPPNNKLYSFSNDRSNSIKTRFSINNGLNPPNKTDVKLPEIIKYRQMHVKKWYPNSTGREMPMTSRFGIENNKTCENLRPDSIFLPNERMIRIKILPVSPIQTENPDAPRKRNKSLKNRGLWGINLS